MSHDVRSLLKPVRRRQGWRFTTQAAVYGLLASSAGGVLLGIIRVITNEPVSVNFMASVLAAGPIIGLLLAVVVRRSWHDAAAAVDCFYQLKDRAVSALEFLEKGKASTLHELQIDDAAHCLSDVDAKKVVPMTIPRPLPYAVLTFTLAVALLYWPLNPPQAVASISPPLPHIVAVADSLKEDFKQLDEVAEKEEDPELKELVEKLQDLAAEMAEPGVDLREALAKLSEMQTNINNLQAQFNEGLVDGQLASLGEAMALAPSFEGAGQALQDAEFEKAAKEIEELDPESLSRKEEKAVKEEMRKCANAMSAAGLGQLSNSVCTMCENMGDGKNGKFKKASRTLAKDVRAQQRRKRVNRALRGLLARLSDCKCDGKNGFTTGRKPIKSLSPSNNFGMTTSGNVLGQKTEMLSQKQLQEITGQAGEGPSDMETTHSPEGRQHARRAYQKVFNKYEKLSQEVLDKEPIPLGHRQMIRKYFELIRPQNEDLAALDEPASSE